MIHLSSETSAATAAAPVSSDEMSVELCPPFEVFDRLSDDGMPMHEAESLANAVELLSRLRDGYMIVSVLIVDDTLSTLMPVRVTSVDVAKYANSEDELTSFICTVALERKRR